MSFTGSSYCKLCAYQISFSHSNSGAESLDFQRVTRSKALAIAAVMSGEGCKKAKNIDRFHCRRAGTFILLPSWPYTCVTLGNDHDRKPESGHEKHAPSSMGSFMTVLATCIHL